MIKFFRKIRQKLVMENKTSKYFKYAIGEILLVIIGILIALQINNWNDNQNNLKEVENAIFQVLEDIEEDIVTVDKIYKIIVYTDSLAENVLNSQYTSNDYKENYRLFWVGLQYSTFDYQVAGINALENLQKIIPKKHKDIVSEINKFYVNYGKRYNKSFEIERTNTTENHRYLLETQDWYYLLRDRKYNDKMIDFYLNSPRYKNMVAMFKSNNRDGGFAREYQVGAVQLLLKLREKLNIEKPLHSVVAEMLGKPQKNEFKKFVGRYKRDDGEISVISNLAGFLTFDGRILKNTSTYNFDFVFSKDWRLEFKEENGEIVELNAYAPMLIGSAKKIKND